MDTLAEEFQRLELFKVEDILYIYEDKMSMAEKGNDYCLIRPIDKGM